MFQRLLDEGHKADVMTFNTLISGFIKHGRDGGAHRTRELYELMLTSRVTPSDVTFALLMKGAAAAGNVERGRWVFNELKELDRPPSVALLNHWISAHGMLRAKQAVELLATFPRYGVEPDLMTYHALLDACMNASVPNRHYKRAAFILALWYGVLCLGAAN